MRIYRYNGSFLSLLLVTIATVSLTAALLVKLFPLVSTKTFYFCQQFISQTLFQIPHPVQNTFLIALIIALILGSLSFFIQVVKTKRLVKALIKKRVVLPQRVEKMATSLGLKEKVYILEDTNCFSFCAGILHPRILITTALVAALSDKELESVFLHEKAHIRNFDPLKMVFGKTVSWLFFFLPIFSEINKNMQATSEILADRFVTSFQKDDIYLRSALKKILMTPQMNFAFTPAIANTDYLEIRIHRLVNPGIRQGFRVSWKSIGTSILFFLLMMFVLQAPVSAFHMENSQETAYFMCSSDNACKQECQHTVQTSSVASPEQLFYPKKQEEKDFSSSIYVTEFQPLRYK